MVTLFKRDTCMASTKKKKSSGNSAGANRLVGWLVSYGMDVDGFAYELRSGRTFVGSNNQNGMRLLTLEDRSVSAPHLAVKATAKHRVLIQDIFSEHGSFITREGKSKEELLSGPTELRHGDWIRLGKSARFQVCLIDGPSSNR